jgi:hypothetical protein
MRSLVRVQVHDEITPKGGKNQSVTKEQPWGLKRKRPDFMREDPLSWTWGCHRQNDGSEWGKVQNVKRTHMCKGATDPSWNELGPVGPGQPAWPILTSVRSPISWAWRWCNPKSVWAPPFAEESHFPERSSTS